MVVWVIFNFVKLPKVSENKQLLIFFFSYNIFSKLCGSGSSFKNKGKFILDESHMIVFHWRIAMHAAYKGSENVCKREILEFLRFQLSNIQHMLGTPPFIPNAVLKMKK